MLAADAHAAVVAFLSDAEHCLPGRLQKPGGGAGRGGVGLGLSLEHLPMRLCWTNPTHFGSAFGQIDSCWWTWPG